MTAKKRGSVSFDRIEIREYSRCLGNNPAVTYGPPLSLDWQYCEAGSFPLEEYEKNRPPRREGYQMLVPGELREHIILSETDATKKELDQVVAETRRDRIQRQICIGLQAYEKWDIFCESAFRKIKRLAKGTNKKKEEQLLWKNLKNMQGSLEMETADASVSSSKIVSMGGQNLGIATR